MKLDNIQKEWFLQTFFKNECFAGWRGIAEKLIDTGTCITTDQGSEIWLGGIGNFIQSKPYSGGVGLIQLSFDLENFMSTDNKYFMSALECNLKWRKKSLIEAEKNYDSMLKLKVLSKTNYSIL